MCNSMYPSVGTYTKTEVTSIHDERKMQAGGCDCGLFADVLVTSPANRIPPGKYRFDRSKMRKHQYTVYAYGREELQTFPWSKNGHFIQ